MSEIIDLTGKRFGRLVVIAYAETVGKQGNRKIKWLCQCDCGKTKTIAGNSLNSGATKSCGCLAKESTSKRSITHGMSNTQAYTAWTNMKTRCNNPSGHDIKNYSNCGIIVCKHWLNSFENFFEDMGKPPKGKSIERIDNNKGYSPENCKWATRKEQMRNTRYNRLVSYQGQTRCVAEWAEILGIKRKILINRLNNHSPEIAFNM